MKVGKLLCVKPKVEKTAFVAPGTHLIGAVEIGKYSSLWFNVVARADINKIQIGNYSNVQDGTILHVSDEQGVVIGNHVTIGHGAIIHACRIGDNALIGMGAIILNHAEIGKNSIVAAGSIVCENFKVPDNTLVMGTPAKIVRKCSKKELSQNIYWAKKYSKLCQEYKK